MVEIRLTKDNFHVLEEKIKGNGKRKVQGGEKEGTTVSGREEGGYELSREGI